MNKDYYKPYEGRDIKILDQHAANTIAEDHLTFPYQLLDHLAHVLMLKEQGIISQEDAAQILGAVLKLRREGPDIVPHKPGLTDLYSNVEEWVIAQEVMFADSTTIQAFNANLRNLVVDKLSGCELVVFNRFTKDMDKMAFHKIVRGISRRPDIAYEYTNGDVEYDEIEDPLPFDINAPVVKIEDGDYALWYRDLSEDPKKYDGKVVEYKGLAAVNPRMKPGMFFFGRQLMTCCVEDIQFAGLLTLCDADKMPENGKWYTMRLSVAYKWHKLYGRKGPVLTLQNIEPAEAPAQPVATFY